VAVAAALLVAAGLLAACAGPRPATDAEPEGPADRATAPAAGSTWAERQLARMTREEKVSHLFFARTTGTFQSTDSEGYRRIVDLVEDFGLGGIIFGLGDPLAQAARANDLQQRAALPLLTAQDMEWGAGMRLSEATTFPPAMAVGATRNARYARLTGYATAVEARALGTHQLYAPVADVNNNPQNPIINVRSFGERPPLVSRMASAFVSGAQEGGAIATLKHFPGHGDTATDSHLDLPVLRFGRARLDTLELVPFRRALDTGVRSVMTGHLALPALEPDSTVPASLSPEVTRKVLRDDLGFEGLIVTDALNMQGVTKNFGVGETAVRALEAGADVLLMSENPRLARAAVMEALETGRLDEAQITASVRRVLETKQELGLHEERLVDLPSVPETVAGPRHQVLSDAVARASVTLLRNDGGLVPMVPPARHDVLAVTLTNGESLDTGRPFRRHLARGPAVASMDTHHLNARSDSIDYAEALDAIEGRDVVVVSTFLPVRSWTGQIGLPKPQKAFLDSLLASDTRVAMASFGNPYVSGAVDGRPDAYLAAYGTDAPSQTAAAQALIGRSPTPGRLPVTIPGEHAFGDGMSRPQVAPRRDVPEAAGMDEERLRRVDSLLEASIVDRAFPGAAVAVGRGQTITRLEGTGYYSYDERREVTPRTRYDLASLTKVVATTTAAMKLYESGRLDLDAPVTRYLPDFGQNGKQAVTIEQLLTHSSGLKPYLAPDERGPSADAIVDTIMAEPLQYEPGTESDYSGLGMVTLMRVVETITGQDFARYCEQAIFEPLGMTDTGFHPADTLASDVAPATDTTGTLIQGTVHDPMARAMGGTSGNAGLFSTADDLARFASMLVNNGRIYGRPFLEPETIDRFTRRADVPESTRALGWDTRSEEGYSSAGEAFGPQSFGHTGYTGTSMWIDPEANVYAILLTNRVYPDDTDSQIREVRPQFADIVHRSIVGPPQPLLPRPPARPEAPATPAAAPDAPDTKR
jgi:beta-glucosidase-like glycosyl hydrolase/CubicO group peptidase (beta-lactamase class C family)